MLGISADSRHALNQFGSGLGRLPFPLLADFYPHGQVAQQYDTFNEESGNPRRTCVIIDKQGIVRLIKTYPPGFPDNDELLEAIKGLPA